MPVQLQRAMAKEAEAARDARAKVTNVYFISVVQYASYNVIGAQLVSHFILFCSITSTNLGQILKQGTVL